MVHVFIPSALRKFTESRAEVTAEGANLRAVLEDLERQFPGIRERIVGGEGLRPGLAVIINGSAASLGMQQPVPEGAELHFVPAISGG